MESPDWFPGTRQPYAPGKMSKGKKKVVKKGGDRQTKAENISCCDNNYRGGIYYRQRNVNHVSLFQSAVIIFTRT